MIQPRVAPARPDPVADAARRAAAALGPFTPEQRVRLGVLLAEAPARGPDWAGYQDAQLHAGPCSPAVCGHVA